MRKILVNTLATTSAVLLITLIVGMIIHGRSILDLGGANIRVYFFFELLGVNFVAHFGLFFTRKFESKYVIFEFLLDLSLIIVVLLIYGAIFDQYTGRRWIFVIIATVIYSFMIFTNMVRERADDKKINEIIQKRKQKRSEKSPFVAS